MRQLSDGSWEITSVREAQALTQSAFPELIRKGMYSWIKRGWDQFQTTWENIYTLMPYNDPLITFYYSAGFGTIPLQNEGIEAGLMGLGTQELLSFRPYKRRGIIAITEELVRFDKTTEIQDMGLRFGVAHRRTQEIEAWDLVRTPPGSSTPELNIPSVYQSASGTNAADGTPQPWTNASTNAFSGAQLFTDIQVMQLQKDPLGNLLGINPDSMAVPFIAQPQVAQVLDSEWLGFTGNANNTGLNGPATYNPYRGMIAEDRIFTSPYFSGFFASSAFTSASFPWMLWQSNGDQAWTYIQLEPLTVIQEEPLAAASAWFDSGIIRTRGGMWGGPALRNPYYVYLDGYNYS